MPTTYRNVTYRLLPVTRSKGKRLEALASSCRWVWNYFLAKNRADYQFDQCFEDTYGIKPTPPQNATRFFSLGKAFTQLRRELPWLHEHSFNIIRYTLKYQADAWRRYFNDPTAGRPRFKSREADRDGFTIPDKVRIQSSSLYIPKIGWCKLRRKGGNPYPDGKPKQARVFRRHGKWFAVIAYDIVAPEQVADGRVIGVDMNVGQVATSNHELICRERDWLERERLRLLAIKRRRYQRQVARRQLGSNRRRKAKQRLAKVSRKIGNKRNRWVHDTSRHIADQAYTVAVEDLQVKQMTKSAKGSVDSPGRHVKQKSGLNRVILDTGWGQLRTILAYKAGNFIEVDPRYTSQTCHVCGHVDPKSRRTRAEFKCVQCGHESNADINAALNIKASAIGASARGRVEPLGYPMIREMGAKTAHV